MSVDLFERRNEKFVIWIPANSPQSKPPQLLLGTVNSIEGGPPPTFTFTQIFKGPLSSGDRQDLWEIDPKDINPPLQNGNSYHYWFEIDDTSPQNLGRKLVTDPIAYTVDYSFVVQSQDQPPAVIKFRDSKLWPCNIDGTEPGQVTVPAQDNIPDNNHIVIYELPVSWVRGKLDGSMQRDAGTFKDVLALFDKTVAGDRFRDVPQISQEAIVSDLGINALELLPAADAQSTGAWGYATANYFAPDWDLGTSSDLVVLIEKIHSMNIRLFTDVVMAFGHDPYQYIAFNQFHIDPPSELSNPESWQSHRPDHRNPDDLRDGYGGRPWRYIETTNTYDPHSGDLKDVHPSWAFHKAHLNRWMSDFGVGGLRLDSVNNIASYDFIRDYKEYAWSLYQARYTSPSPAKFLVIGEELSVPLDMITIGTLNALWNEPFQGRIRLAILGQSGDGDNFEWTVRKFVDCTLDHDHPFTDGAQAVNYITSHDTGFRKERLYNFLDSNGVTDIERRAKLAFACFLTAVGIPMIFAGEEFCDQRDRPDNDDNKQIDPVNYERKAQDWRTRVFNYVSTLVHFRKECQALGDDDTDFIHVDNSRGGKIMAWKRGGSGHEPVMVVANFSDDDTQGEEYFVPNWPDRERGDWREVTQGRNVPAEWVGREPLMHWEAKVYTYWR